MAPPADPQQRAVIDLTARFVAADGDAFERVRFKCVQACLMRVCVCVCVCVGVGVGVRVGAR